MSLRWERGGGVNIDSNTWPCLLPLSPRVIHLRGFRCPPRPSDPGIVMNDSLLQGSVRNTAWGFSLFVFAWKLNLIFSGSSLLVYLIYFCLHKIRDYVLISVFIMKWSLRITIFSKARRNTLKCKHILYVYFSDFYFSICLYSFYVTFVL